MSVVIETTLGDITVDLYLEQRPVTCLNFLKLCKMKYYNFNLFHTIRSGFIAQTGDPTGEGSGGESVFGLLEGPSKRFFSGEKMPKIRHTNAGLISMVCTDDMMVGSQFFFTLGSELDSLDGIHCVIGEVTEGQEILRKLNEVICDESHRPYQDVRITHTVVLEDPFNDPAGLRAPSRSPSPSAERLKGGRIAPDEDIDETQGKSAAEIQEIIEEKEAKARATILEIVGDLPDADIAPPENVLFVCKLNPVTTDEDLEIIFSRFGKIVGCEVIRDKKTGDSLQYAFIEFSDKKSCEDAYFKMDNVLIDDRRIHVDFSQSVSKMRWLGKGRGIQHFDDDKIKDNKKKARRPGSEERTGDQNSKRYHDKEEYKNKRNHDERKGERDRNNDRRKESERNSDKRRENRDYEKKIEQDRDYVKKRDQEKNNDRQKEYTKGKRNEIESRHHSHREKSRSRSHEKTESKREKTRERAERDHEQNNYRVETNGPKKSDREENHKRLESSIDRRQRESHTNSHKSKYDSPSRERDHSNDINDRSSQKKSIEVKNKKSSKDKNKAVDEKGERKENSTHVSKKRHADESESSSKNKRLNKEKKNEPRTPSPSNRRNKKKVIEKRKKNDKKVRNNKKKRKDSTSSESETTDSSSSSDSSSTSEDDKRKRSKRKRKRSTSSSSDTTDSSSSTSSSSDSSSDTSSSSSDDEKTRKRKKNNKRKPVKESKK